MREEDKAKEELLNELDELRQRIVQFDVPSVGSDSGGEPTPLVRLNENSLTLTGEATFDWDIRTNRLEWSDGLRQIVGASPETFTNNIREFLIRIHPLDIAATSAALSAHFERDEPYQVDFRIKRDDGEYVWVCSTGKAVKGADGQPVRMRGAIADINQRKQAEEILRQSEERYRSLIEYLPEGVILAGSGGQLIEVNQSAADMLGYERYELLEMDVRNLILPDQITQGMKLFGRLMEHGQVSGEIKLGHKSGGEVDTEISLVRLPDGNHLATLRKATERKRDGQSALAPHNAEYTSDLISGIVYNLNNLLTPIIGYAQLGMRALPSESHVSSYLEEIQRSAERIASLAQRLLTLSGKQLIEAKILNLNDVVTNLEMIIRDLVGDGVLIEMKLASDLKSVRVDQGQIEQVLVNIATNARDAMPSGGNLTIETANTTLDGVDGDNNFGATAGEYVVLSMSDTGVGMTEEVKSRVFEPFFTTKSPGGGAGLGLATTHGIIKQNRGYIEIQSEPGRGTTLRIYLPVAETD